MESAHITLILMLVLGIARAPAKPSLAVPNSGGVYESYFLHLGDHPNERHTEWDGDVQGITHDDDAWFITQTATLWKIPVSHDLSDSVCQVPVFPAGCAKYVPGVIRKSLHDYPELSDYNHFGDLTYHAHEGFRYLVIPLTGEDVDPAIGVFRANAALEYVDHLILEFQVGAGWVAVDPISGDLFSSSSNPTLFQTYRVDWDWLNESDELLLLERTSIPIRDAADSALELHSMQGGVFSESGQLLYVVCGYFDTARASDGIHVFDTQTWRRIRQSSRDTDPFRYEFHPGSPKYEEPQGLTIWDLEDGPPGIRGTLHVLMLDNDYDIGGDEIYLKHYTESIYVDRAYTGDEYGRPEEPLNTVTEANDMAWDGQRIWVRAGSYPETLTFSKRLEILAFDGPVIIGE